MRNEQRRRRNEEEKNIDLVVVVMKTFFSLTEPLLRRLVEVGDGASRGHVEVEPLGGAGGKGLFFWMNGREGREGGRKKD